MIPAPIISAYLTSKSVSIKSLGNGLINKTYLVTVGSTNIVLQQLSSIFSEDMLKDYDIVSQHLQKQGWEVAEIIPTLDGRRFINDKNGSLWRAMRFIPSDAIQDLEINPENLRSMGELLGELHHALSKLSYVPTFSLPHFHDTVYYEKRLRKVIDGLEAEPKAMAHEALQAFEVIPALPGRKQLIHGDPQANNMLFRKGKPFTIVDFDTLMLGTIWLDLGDLLRSIAEKRLDDGNVFELEIFNPLIAAYWEATRPGMNQQEFTKIAKQAAALIALELTMRFLIDIVEDSYFSWNRTRYKSRKEFNLARAKIQWQIYTTLSRDGKIR